MTEWPNGSPVFPVVGFFNEAATPLGGPNERFRYFPDPETLVRVRRRSLRTGELTGMLLVDSEGNA